ncbi:hypothetical protein GGD66_005805 [Bradyrhizobium sp. CIR48]|nr:hypothetical protein [Bradyrhizobium sp. CIR48]
MFLLATASRGIGHPTRKLLSEEGRHIFTCTRPPPETDNDVHVNLGIRPTVARAIAQERLAGAPLHLL